MAAQSKTSADATANLGFEAAAGSDRAITPACMRSLIAAKDFRHNLLIPRLGAGNCSEFPNSSDFYPKGDRT